jgi:hypothetical protein
MIIDSHDYCFPSMDWSTRKSPSSLPTPDFRDVALGAGVGYLARMSALRNPLRNAGNSIGAIGELGNDLSPIPWCPFLPKPVNSKSSDPLSFSDWIRSERSHKRPQRLTTDRPGNQSC